MSNSNGKSRYVIHYTSIHKDYATALKITKQVGGKKYDNRHLLGRIVFQAERIDIEDLSVMINHLIEKAQ